MNIIKLRGELGSRYLEISSRDNLRSYIFGYLERGALSLDAKPEVNLEGNETWHKVSVVGNQRAVIRSGTIGFVLILDEVELVAILRQNTEANLLLRWLKQSSSQALTSQPVLQAQLTFYLDSILQEHRRNAPGSASLINAWLLCVLISLWREAEPSLGDTPKEPEVEQRLGRFRALLELHYRDRWNVEAYATALNMTADNLHHICTKQIQKPPSQLIRERTLEAAMTMLLETNAPIGQIADATGFMSPPYFSTYFKKETGLAPRAFRISARRNAKVKPSFSDWP